jgi:hypothetical protein
MPYFYPNALGGVLSGIGIALLIEAFREPNGLVGLGLGGAIAINLCDGFTLAAISSVELVVHRKR